MTAGSRGRQEVAVVLVQLAAHRRQRHRAFAQCPVQAVGGHPDDAVLDVMEDKLMKAIPVIAKEIGLEFSVKKVWDSPAVRFDPECISAVRKGTEKAGFASRDMVSGAGHDAAYIARVAPTTMIFVPCERGVSHNEIENAAPADLAAGTRVLVEALVRLANR